MKINTVATLLFALQASTASGFAIDSCDDDDIQTDDDCTAFCKHLAGGKTWSGHMKGPNTKITECSCTFGASENVYTCTREVFKKPPVTITEDCEERDISTWPDCQEECSTLADGTGTGYAASHDGGKGNISACYCTYGYRMEDSFTCNRKPTPPPPIPQKRDRRCTTSDISDQDTCFNFCLDYKRTAEYVGSANGLLKCRCRLGQGGQIDFECDDSYLRSGSS